MKLLKDILTGKDNETYDSGRVWFAICLLYFFAQGIYADISGHPWTPTDFATGVSIIAVAFSMNMKIKESTEMPPYKEFKHE